MFQMPAHPTVQLDQLEHSPVLFEGEELERFRFRLDQMLSRAEREMTGIHERARRYRRVYRLLRKQILPFEGAPNLTLPLSKNKTDGVLAHMLDAIEQTPLFSFTPETEGSVKAVPLYDMLLEREVNASNSREKFTSGAAKAAVSVGTAIMTFALTEMPDGEIFVKAKTVDLEHFYTDRINVDDFSRSFVAWYRRKHFFDLEEDAERGVIDGSRLEDIRHHSDANVNQTLEEEEYNFNEAFWREENQLVGFYECYLRYKSLAGHRALYQVLYHRPTRTVLALRENPFAEAFDAPPFVNIRVMSQDNRVFGMSVMEVLDSIQELADDSINTHLTLQRYATNPVTIYNQNSPFAQALEDGLIPGMTIPQHGAPDRADVHTIEFPNQGLALNDVQLSKQFADEATFNDESVAGTGGGSRQTAYEYSARLNIGTLRLRLNLRDFSYDMARAAEMYWAMLNVFKNRRRGVFPVYQERHQKLLAFDDIPAHDVDQMLLQLLVQSVPPERIQSEEQFFVYMLMAKEAFDRKLTDGMIPGTRRQDVNLQLTGTKIIADKIGEAQMYESLGVYVQLVPYADMDSRVWYFLKRVMETKGIKDWKKLIGTDPDKRLQQRQFLEAVGPFAETLQHSVTH